MLISKINYVIICINYISTYNNNNLKLLIERKWFSFSAFHVSDNVKVVKVEVYDNRAVSYTHLKMRLHAKKTNKKNVQLLWGTFQLKLFSHISTCLLYTSRCV